MDLLNAYILYQEYSTDRLKILLRVFQEKIANSLLDYNEEEWPDSSNRILHDPSLPVDERFNGPPVVVVPALPSAMPGPSSAMSGPPSAMPGPSTAMPGPSSSTPSTSSDFHASEEKATYNPGVPQSTHTLEFHSHATHTYTTLWTVPTA